VNYAGRSQASIFPLTSFLEGKTHRQWLGVTNETIIKSKILSTSQLLACRKESDRDCERCWSF
jgi:hypothetical protein